MLDAAKLEIINTQQQEMQQQAREEARCEFSIVIGYSEESEEIPHFEAEIIRALCLEYQGCSVNRGQGYWLCDDEYNIDNDIFEVANPASERNITINLSVYKDLEEEAYNFIQKQVAFAKGLFGIDVEWIHCTTQTVRARHFQV